MRVVFKRGQFVDKLVFDYFLYKLDLGDGSVGKALVTQV